jgi:Fe-S-cluster-containing dehydrogenase component
VPPLKLALQMPFDDRHSLQLARQAALEGALARQPDALSRRRFLELLGASLALAGASACAPPRDQIVPYVRPPEDVVPGKPLFFATAHVLGGFADGVLVENQMGRPTKVEGNPQHPASLGGTDAFAQASVLTLYDPNRSQTVRFNGQISTWPDFLRSLRGALAQLQASGGSGLRILSESTTSPSLAAQIQSIQSSLGNARWHRWQAVHRDSALAGAVLAFGQPVEARYHFDAADVVLSLDADPLAYGPGHLRWTRQISARRQPEQGPMNRMYAVESTPTSMGALADHRLPLAGRDIEPFAWALAEALGVPTGASATATPTASNQLPRSVPAGWLQALAEDLRSHGQRSLVIAGDGQPAVVHALVHAINAALGNVGTTVEYSDAVEVDPVDHTASLRELVADMIAGQVQLLLILGGNPAYTAPADVGFASALGNVGMSIHLGLFIDETAALCKWHVPELHALETWGDARAFDGSATVMQPLIAPLYQGWSAHEVLAAFGDQPDTSAHNVVKGYWQNRLSGQTGDFDLAWRTLLHDGVVPDSAQPTRQLSVRADWAAAIPAANPPGAAQPSAPGGGQTGAPGGGQTGAPGGGLANGAAGSDAAAAGLSLELVFRPDPSLYDGRFASNGWLMELPRPFTKLSWDNVALLSPATASQLGVANEDIVELRYQGRSVRAPVWVQPGQADGSVGITLGYGRRQGAGAGTGVGFDANALRTSAAPWFDSGVDVVRTADRYPLASTQGHYDMQGRNLVQTTTPGGPPVDGSRPSESLYPAISYPGNAWGMVIDQSACVGCNACIVACQAENNIPVVGKQEVGRGREMLWLRLDTYYEGPSNNPAILQQLVPCMQCENAPCELVCPVGATAHSDEGLNDMVYNRCVGTRYCSNNCPYKVRHFNFFEYSDFDTPVLKMLRNPEVTVRSRGVMEKCTYCVQRITAGRIQAERENRPIADGEVVTACQAACPANAIVFGNLNDSTSLVARARQSARNYTLLADLNTRPRTTYQAVVRNPNPAMPSA